MANLDGANGLVIGGAWGSSQAARIEAAAETLVAAPLAAPWTQIDKSSVAALMRATYVTGQVVRLDGGGGIV